ncbi:D-alanyl-D-alanine carboxypeptidase (penicillin-binding protein 5/6) [Amaricoccus macauensis]|uniref:serine-type D-Ala-D-Ala carboxypeptidase n=1 Tax=Amaricoccus macauensis TaxID=57001 RepID=A0A840SUL9_9RHOB|nr:D-alanyl-D-alanine carboxypeptidase family protein [Amaricoccus macauensis]MBB5222842.1 D-alanyl-D-alanine carboxypeptidase (penicillin-binding protein 5/6) [Amaricoccus macauensis]
MSHERRLLSTALLFSLALSPLAGHAFETRAREALVIDDDTGMVLFSKDADVPMPPASMSKLMTLYVLFEAIRDGRVSKDTEFLVSPHAQSMVGSRMFVEAGTRVRVEDLIQGIIVQSGNDACVVVAEGLAGTEATFARQMTKRAQELGLKQSHFVNASGLPADGQVMSAHDLVLLAQHIIADFPEEYKYFQETEFTWNGIHQPNRNPLLKLGLGVDGLKTGHTAEAGFGLVGSAVQNGQRILFMMGGLGSEAERASETRAVVQWAFGAFDTVRFFTGGETVAEADVWLGAAPRVPIVAPKDIQMLVPREDRSGMTSRIVYRGPLEAPIAAGQPVAKLLVDVPGKDQVTFDLVAGADVPRGGLLTRLQAAAELTRARAASYLPGH